MELLTASMREAMGIIGILLNAIIALLLYIFKLHLDGQKKEVKAVRDVTDTHEKAIEHLNGELHNLAVVLPTEYVKQGILAAIQMEMKGDVNKLFDRLDEVKTMLISMGADRRK